MQPLRRRPREAPRSELPRPGEPRGVTPGAGGQGTVQVNWGPLTESLEVVGMTVADVYRLLRQPFNIAPGVRALVNGRGADAEQRLTMGDVLEFTRPAGEKGADA